MAADSTTQSDLLRLVYRRYMRALFNIRSILLQRLSRDTETWAEGAGISIPVHWAGSGGMGWSDAGTLPTAGHQVPKRLQFAYYHLYGRIRLSGIHMRRARTSYAAEARPFTWETTNLVKQLRHGLNKDLYGDGSGKMATVAGATSSTSFTIDSIAGLPNNSIVDVLLISNGQPVAGARGLTVSVAAKTKTVTITNGALADWGTIAAAPTTYAVYRQNSYNQACMGLDGIVSESNPSRGNYGGIDRTDPENDIWKAIVDANGGTKRQLTFRMIQDLIDRIQTEGNGNPSIMLCNPAVWSAIAERLVNDKTYGGERMKLNGWCEAVMFSGIPLAKDKHCPLNRLYVLDESYFTLYQNSEGDWIDYDGSVLRAISGEDAYEASWVRDLELVCTAPNAQGLIDDIDPLQIAA